MGLGSVSSAARRDNGSRAAGMLLLTLIALGVLVAHREFLVGCLRGPTRLDPDLLAHPKEDKFVRIDGDFHQTNVVEKSTLELFHLPVSEQPSATVLWTDVGGTPVFVKAPIAFSGRTIEGRLVESPANLPELLRTKYASWMVDAAVPYRESLAWPVGIGGGLFVLGLVGFLRARARAESYANHPELARLRDRGNVEELVSKIESELAVAGEEKKAGLFFLTDSFVVRLEPQLLVIPRGDLVGVGYEVIEVIGKLGSNYKHQVLLWRRGDKKPVEEWVPEDVAQAMLASFAAWAPGVVQTDSKAFADRWRG